MSLGKREQIGWSKPREDLSLEAAQNGIFAGGKGGGGGRRFYPCRSAVVGKKSKRFLGVSHSLMSNA